MCSRHQEHNFADMGLIKTNPSMVGVNGPRYEIEQPRCAPRAYGVHVRSILATKRVTTQLVNICYQTKSAIAHSIVNVRVRAIFVRGSSTHQAIARTQFALKRTGQCMDEVKPCETWMYFAHEVKLVTCGILASQSPQAAPQPFRLNILTWFLVNSSCLVFV